MRNKQLSLILFLPAFAAMLSACGSGGVAAAPAPIAQPITALIKVSTQGTPSNAGIGAVQVSVELPAGVSVKTQQNTAQVDSSVVSAASTALNADLIIATYTASSNKVTVSIAKAAGFSVGEFVTISCAIAEGSRPAAADFRVTDLSVWDTNGALITGLSTTIVTVIN